MTCDSSQHLSSIFLTLVYYNLFSIVSFMYLHPLHLAYLLYFSPYILQLLSFFFPLLLTTSILLLLLLLHCMLESEAAVAVCLLDQLASAVVATIGNVFEWEFEVMSELYNSVAEEDPAEENSEHLHGNLDFDEHSSLNCETRGDQILEPPSKKNSEEGESKLSECDHVGTGDRASLKSNFDPETPNRRESSQVINRSRSNETCDGPRYYYYAREVSPELSLEKSRGSEVLVESHSSSFVPQTPERSCEILAHRSLVRRAKQRCGVSESLSRSVSMRITNELHKQSTLNCEAVQGPNEMFWECSEKTELSKSQSMRTPSTGNSRIREGRAVGSNLKRDESMGREKEWRRTLACKLYEERMSSKIREERKVDEGAEEMDLLWEAYEADADKADKLLNNTVKRSGGKKKILVKEEEEEEEEEEDEVAQLCCLQALRMSTGKMKLGVGRPNLAKISKAFRGIGGLLHRSGSRSRRSG